MSTRILLLLKAPVTTSTSNLVSILRWVMFITFHYKDICSSMPYAHSLVLVTGRYGYTRICKAHLSE
jgi:hypothetical protein